MDRMIKRLETNLKLRNDLHNDILRTTSSNVQTISLDAETVGNPRDDQKIRDLLDDIERKEKEINALLDLKEAADRKRRVSKKKNELSYNIGKDISELERRVREAQSDQNRMLADSGRDRNVDIDLSKKERKIEEQEAILEQLEDEKIRLEERLEHGAEPQGDGYDEERTIEELKGRLGEMNRKIESSKRKANARGLEKQRRILQEKEEYIVELERQLID